MSATETFWLSPQGELLVGPAGDGSGTPVNPGAASAALAAAAPANAEGYAAWTFDPATAFTTNNPTNLAPAWPTGQISLTQLLLPAALSGLNGSLTCAWRIASGAANTFLGIYSNAGGTLARQWVSPDQSATASMVLRLQTSLTSFPAGSIWIATLFGTQAATAGGPVIAFGQGQTGTVTRSGTTGRICFLAGSATSLPASLTLSSFTTAKFGYGWFAID